MQDRCGQKTRFSRSKIGQTRCLPLWISNSPFRIIDGGSCSISLVVNQSAGGIFNPHSLTQDLPSLSVIEQTRFAYRLHATWKYVLSGNAQHATVQRLSDLFFIWYKAATVCTTWFNIQNKLLLSGKFFRLHWPLIPHPGGRRCLHMLTSTAYTHEVNILERREDTWARLLIGLQCAFSIDIASNRTYEISGCYA